MSHARITTRFYKDHIIVDIPFRRLDLENSKILKTKLAELLLGTGIENIMINLVNINFIDTQGLEVLLFAYNAIKEKNGKVVLIAPKPYVVKTLLATRLYNNFEIVYSTEEAINKNSIFSYLPKPLLNFVTIITNQFNMMFT